MKSGLVALDPMPQKNESLDRFMEILRLFKSRRILSGTSVGSIVQPYLYAVPWSFYREAKGQFAKEARSRIELAIQGQLDVDEVHVMTSDTHAIETHVSQLTRYTKRINADALIFASQDRGGLSHLLLGSYSETAALTAQVPVFIVKPWLKAADFPDEIRFVLAVDVAEPPNAAAVRWVAELAKPANATIDLLYVEPRRRAVADSLRQRRPKDEADRVLSKVEASFKAKGIHARINAIKESESVARTIADLTEKTRPWLVIATTPERSKARKLLLGSTARKILSLTPRPFLSLRLH